MALPSHPNAITLATIQTEFGGADPSALSEYYAGGLYVPAGTLGNLLGASTAIPSSGLISLSHFHGASAYVAPIAALFGNYINTNASPVYKDFQVFNMGTNVNVTTAVTLATYRIVSHAVSGNGRGYALQGYLSTTLTGYNEIDGYIFSTNTAINPAAVTTRLYNSSNSVNSSSAGYLFWGATTNIGATETTLDKFLYSTETLTATTVAAYEGQNSTAGMSFTTKGVILSGVKPASKTSTSLNLIVSIDFSTDTVSSSAGLITVRLPNAPRATFNTSTTGYYLDGNDLNAYHQYTLATGALSVLANVLGNTTNEIGAQAASSNTSTLGYIFGGNAPSIGINNTIKTFTFSTSTLNILSVTLTLPTAGTSAAQTGSL